MSTNICFYLRCMSCCFLLPIFGNAQEDTTCRNIKYAQTYPLVDIFYQQISEISAFNDYEGGMAAAKKASKPALIYFNAHGSINARKFDEEVLSNPEIKHIIDSKFKLIILFVDDPTLLPQTKRLPSKNLNRILKTVGDLNMDFQIAKFEDVRQPMFFIVDAAGEKKIGSTLAINREEFLKFLSRESN